MSAKEKDALAEQLSGIVDVDYAEIKRKRLMHLMNPAEVREVAAAVPIPARSIARAARSAR